MITSSRFEQPLVVAVARPQHHAMLAKGNRLLVAVGRDVTHGNDRHCTGLLGDCGLRLRGLGRVAEKGDRQVAADSDQLPLDQIEKLVQTPRSVSLRS